VYRWAVAPWRRSVDWLDPVMGEVDR
jgi:hypothetical protein